MSDEKSTNYDEMSKEDLVAMLQEKESTIAKTDSIFEDQFNSRYENLPSFVKEEFENYKREGLSYREYLEEIKEIEDVYNRSIEHYKKEQTPARDPSSISPNASKSKIKNDGERDSVNKILARRRARLNNK